MKKLFKWIVLAFIVLMWVGLAFVPLVMTLVTGNFRYILTYISYIFVAPAATAITVLLLSMIDLDF